MHKYFFFRYFLINILIYLEIEILILIIYVDNYNIFFLEKNYV